MSKSRYIVPNLFTSLNFLLGVWAIVYGTGAFAENTAEHMKDLVTASNLIILSCLLDKLDGFAAKKLNASSEFGAQFDSLADLIAFGLAPAFNLFFGIKTLMPEFFASHIPLVVASVSLYVLCAAMRLAKYNAMDADSHPHFFVGMPSTFAGVTNALILILAVKYELFGAKGLETLPIIFLNATALLMVSPLYLSKLRRHGNWPVDIFQAVNLIGAYVAGFAMIWPEYLLGLVLIYFSVGFAHGLIKRSIISQEEKTLPAPAEKH
jgi:CDP-diacylglycerol--serine O-phosphatidyltransferase